jgi:hypothetical protein
MVILSCFCRLRLTFLDATPSPSSAFSLEGAMRLTSLRLSAGIGTFLLCAASSGTALAQSRTTVDIDRTVRLPGVVLPAGQYEFTALETTGVIIVTRKIDGHRAFVRVTPVGRNKDGPAFGMRSGVRAGSVPEIATWYPEGGLSGYAFAATAADDGLSAKEFGVLDQRLTVANKAVSDAKRQLVAAETDRNTIRTERLHAK